MKIRNANQVALIIGVVTGALSALLLFVLIGVVGVQMPYWGIGLIILISFLSSYGVSFWAVEVFLHGKIKLIYRVIQLPGKQKENAKAGMRNKDVLDKVQQDVETWASLKQEEITALREQADFRREFIGNLAHELKTPTFNMQGYLLTLLEGGLEDPKINYNYLTRADQNLERLVALIEDLDSISKLEGGREELKITKINIAELAEKVFGLFELRASKKNIALRFNEKYEKGVFVMADKEKISQVLSNLVINAIHYGDENGFCEVRFYDTGASILIEVKDDGVGIESEHLARLFERFYRVDKSRSRHEGGTGLGLAICKHIIESHGQSMNVRSTPGVGTTFSFSLEKAK